jgi:hypothetical protein
VNKKEAKKNFDFLDVAPVVPHPLITPDKR